MLRLIDNFLNSFTMYRVVSYALVAIAVIAIVCSFFGLIYYSPLQLISSALFIVLVCFFTNILIGKLLKAPLNVESSGITALILFFVLTPPTTPKEYIPIFLTAVIAMASKYIFAIGKKHIFNPAAIALVIMGVFGSAAAGWWVATDTLLPVVIIVGLLMVRKIRRFHLFFAFVITAITMIVGTGILTNRNIMDLFKEVFTSWPIIFFATFMLTEPLTTPPTKKLQMLYGVFVGVLFGAQFQIGPLYSTPELALVIGNIFSYSVSPKKKLFLKLKEKIQLSPQVYDFVFTPHQKLVFHPGQYLEWTLDHKKPDTRGNRRYFTIASSPTEDEVHLGVRYSEKSSSFKKSLANINTQHVLIASQLAGDFTLPIKDSDKLVFIAGGIGITPFRSMVKYLIDTNQKRDIVLIYACSSPADFVYKEIFNEATKTVGLKTIYVITNKNNAPENWTGQIGYLTKEIIKEKIPDYNTRKFYISGPQMMVHSYHDLLDKLGISKTNVITDYFPGF